MAEQRHFVSYSQRQFNQQEHPAYVRFTTFTAADRADARSRTTGGSDVRRLA